MEIRVKIRSELTIKDCKYNVEKNGFVFYDNIYKYFIDINLLSDDEIYLLKNNIDLNIKINEYSFKYGEVKFKNIISFELEKMATIPKPKVLNLEVDEKIPLETSVGNNRKFNNEIELSNINTLSNNNINIEGKKIYINWKKIYSNITLAQDAESVSKNKLLQQKMDSTFNENKRALFIPRLKASSMDWGVLKFFVGDELYKFIYSKSNSLILRKPEKIVKTIANNFESFKDRYNSFIKKTWLKDYSSSKINDVELIEKINKEIDRKFRKMNEIALEAKRNYIETGNWTTYIGWPFIEGKIGDHSIRTPLAYFPIKVDKKLNNFTFTKIDFPIKINVQLIKGIYAYDKKILKKLTIDFDDLDEIFKEYASHELVFNNQIGEFENLSEILKKDFEEIQKSNFFELKNIFVIENRIASEYVYMDAQNIFRDHGDFSIPKENKDVFGLEKNILQPNSIPLDIDENKNEVISHALNDSLVIQGPPGTGKSEVITSFLALAAEKNDSCLLVAEKNAALAVVYSRLEKKFGINKFALKINSNGMNNSIFWEKILKNIESLSKRGDKLELKKYNDLYIEFLQKQKILKESFINQGFDISNFWDIFEEYIEINKILPSSNKSLSERFNNFKIRFDEYRENKLKIFKIETDQEHLNSKKDRLNYEIAKLESIINNILITPFCYLPRSKISFLELIEFTNDKKLFKYISNGQCNIFNLTKWYKIYRNDIIELINQLNDWKDIKKSLELLDFNIKNDKWNKLKKVFKNENDKFIRSYKYEDKELKQKLLHWYNSDLNISKICVLENLFFEFIKYDQKHDLNENYQTNINNMKKIFEANKKIIQMNITNNIREKIENNEVLLNQFKQLSALAKNSKRKPKPSLTIKRYFLLIKTLFPIIIGTPNEISQYFPNDDNLFDFGLFDEASQMLSERALPVVHRCKKIIVAGDKKQMAPSYIFKTFVDDTDEIINENEDLDAALLADSFLGWAESRYRNEFLTYHYRSQSAKLIEYSNENFYKGKLIVNDTPNSLVNPIEVFDVDGIFENKVNLVETKKIIEILPSLMSAYKKIGIITMNKDQMNLITEQISYNEELRNYMNSIKNDKSIFVKNIENVQGDEADLIIFSLQYSSNNNEKSIRVPNILNKNRLNVAITRAKSKMIVIKSFIAAEISTFNKETAKGILFSWVSWLENIEQNEFNHPAQIYNNEGKSRSPFETEFIELIEKSLTPNIKVLNNFKINGFELDIIIFDKNTNTYLAAIELDGHTYHNTTKQKYMDYYKTIYFENMGWKIRRISSLTYFRDRDKCIIDTLTWLNF